MTEFCLFYGHKYPAGIVASCVEKFYLHSLVPVFSEANVTFDLSRNANVVKTLQIQYIFQSQGSSRFSFPFENYFNSCQRRHGGNEIRYVSAFIQRVRKEHLDLQKILTVKF